MARNNDGHRPFRVGEPALSPDGRWLAYYAVEQGGPRIYVRPFPHVDNGGPWNVSLDLGVQPVWSPNDERTSVAVPVRRPQLDERIRRRRRSSVLLHDRLGRCLSPRRTAAGAWRTSRRATSTSGSLRGGTRTTVCRVSAVAGHGAGPHSPCMSTRRTPSDTPAEPVNAPSGRAKEAS